MTPPPATTSDLIQTLCQEGSELLVQTDYLAAETALAWAEALAWKGRDWDTLSRLYMPLQECRRQRRQRCGEGMVRLDLVASSAADALDAEKILADYPHGQLLVAGWNGLAPARRVRELAAQRGLYVETFLAAAFTVTDGDALDGTSPRVAIFAAADSLLPASAPRSGDQLKALLPASALFLAPHELPSGAGPGNATTYAQVMALWERLHRPFLAAADATVNLIERMEAYRATIGVDYACELAHQRLSAAAYEMARR